jgi:hydrogenase nickel incorporation protein HypA/HybF
VHEYSLVEALVRRVEEEARRRGALAVHALSVRVGELSGVDPDLFQTAYETFRAGTLCEKAPLAVSRIEASWSCGACRKPIARGGILRCAACGAPARLDEGGDALLLDRIEMEVP